MLDRDVVERFRAGDDGAVRDLYRHYGRLVYTIAEGALGANMLSVRPTSGEDGYFLLLASPQVKDPGAESRARPKTVVFALDRFIAV